MSKTVQGTIQASPSRYGETLESEQLKGGAFLTHADGGTSLSPEAFRRALELEVGHTTHRLYGGA
eukprot:8290496-Prorocentrum_lima.AAC.1